MNKANELKKKGGVGLASLSRPRFSPGLLLEDEDLTAAVDYTRNMMRLLFRSLFGCGVICGLKVDAYLTCNGSRVRISIKPGVALDCMGNPIEIAKEESVEFDAGCGTKPNRIWVAVCYMEKCCRPRDVSCSPDDDGHVVQTRSCDGYEVKLYDAPPECACSCEMQESRSPDRRQKCCDEHSTDAAANSVGSPAGSGQTDPSNGDKCSCYADHNSGKCACECGCTCVVIGRIHTIEGAKEGDLENSLKLVDDKSPTPALKVYDDMVRRIRPVLTGYWQCLNATEKILGAVRNPVVSEQNEEGTGGATQ